MLVRSNSPDQAADIGFLLKFMEVAVNLWLDAQKPAAMSEWVPEEAPPNAVTQSPARTSSVTEAKARKAEVFAILGMTLLDT